MKKLCVVLKVFSRSKTSHRSHRRLYTVENPVKPLSGNTLQNQWIVGNTPVFSTPLHHPGTPRPKARVRAVQGGGKPGPVFQNRAYCFPQSAGADVPRLRTKLSTPLRTRFQRVREALWTGFPQGVERLDGPAVAAVGLVTTMT